MKTLFFGLALAALALVACGGSGSLPVTPPTAVPLTVTPASLTMQIGQTEKVTISGGKPPYWSFWKLVNCSPSSQIISIATEGTQPNAAYVSAYAQGACTGVIGDSAGNTVALLVTVH